MSTINGAQLLEQLNWRYAVKKFDPTKKISAQDWSVLEQALLLTPSSYGLQPWRFLVIQNKEIRKQLTPLSWKQTQVEDCSNFVVLTYMKTMTEEHIDKYLNSIAKTRGVTVESMAGFRKSMVGDVVHGPRSKVASEWAIRQCYIAMGNLMTSAAMLGVDTCPMEGIDPAGYDKVLGLTDTNFATVAAVACGYRHNEDFLSKLKKSRFELNEVVRTV